MDRLGGLVVIAPARIAGDPGSNPGPGENLSLKFLISTCQMVILKAKITHTHTHIYKRLIISIYMCEEYQYS